MSANSKNATPTMRRREFVMAGACVTATPLLGGPAPRAYPMQPFLAVLNLDGTLVNVGALEKPQDVDGPTLVRGRKSIAGSLIGDIAETQDVIDFCSARNIKADVEVIGVADINKAFEPKLVVRPSGSCR